MRNRLILILAPILMAGCTVYSPQLASIPLMTHKGEAQVSTSLQMDILCQPQGNLDVAYAVTDHIAVQAFGSTGGGKNYTLQGKVGYYLPMENHSVLEAYLGGGYGRHRYTSGQIDSLGNPRDDFNATHQPLYLQVNYGFANLTKAHIDVAIGLKGGMLSYDSYYTSSSAPQTKQGTYGLLEPQLSLRLGPEKVKWQLQLGYCHILIPDGEPAVSYVPWSASIGLNFGLDTRRWRQHQQ